MKALTTEEFIEKAKKTHGNKYDYSKTVYINQKTDVVIICPIHGEFLQKPNNHYMGAGCPYCSNNHKLDCDSFVKKAKLIHGDLYDYSRVKYMNNKTPVIIICKFHGEFEQTPDKHLQGRGCPLCANDKLESTNLAKYGVRRPLQSKTIRDKMQKTVFDRYGVDNVSNCNMFVEKRRQTCLKKYGVDCSLKSDIVKSKIRKTCQQKYGGNSPFSNKAVINKARKTIANRYGTDNVAKLPNIQAKINCTKRYNNTFCSSVPEDCLYKLLIEYFGSDDIVRQYYSDKYPFACDFYIKSKNLYIELNGNWTHGGHWFSVNDDSMIYQQWQDKAVYSKYYSNAVDVWTKSDVKKRECAKQNNLNYVVFWDIKLRDAELWFACNCPNGRDWDYEYSWLQNRVLNLDICYELTNSPLRISLIAKKYQWREFYKNEIQLWNDNKIYKNNLPLQVYLYHNRWKYLGKLPNELSDFEILRGFKISGVYNSYSVFDISLMAKVIEKYAIKSIYDPFAGWGERMLYCYFNDIQYLGVDINSELHSGYCNMMKDYNMSKQNFIVADSRNYTDIAADAVVTCPPYFNVEQYTDSGLENLSYNEFLDSFRQVVQNCFDSDVKLFCFQINQKYKTDMKNVVESVGYIFVHEMTYDKNKVSHFNRVNGVSKHEYESMLIFRKST